jgi:hypothetical protein
MVKFNGVTSFVILSRLAPIKRDITWLKSSKGIFIWPVAIFLEMLRKRKKDNLLSIFCVFVGWLMLLDLARYKKLLEII